MNVTNPSRFDPRFTWSSEQKVAGSYEPTSSEVMPPNTNRGLSVGGRWIRLGSRKLAAGSCRDEIVAAIQAVESRASAQVFTVRDIYEEMVAVGTRYAESTVFKTMQRMKAPPDRPPFVRLARAGPDGFRLELGT